MTFLNKTAHKNFTIESDFISVKEVYDLMGYEGEVAEPFLTIINDELKRLPNLVDIEGGYRILESKNENETIALNKQTFEIGKTVSHLLKNNEYIAVFSCTAGKEISDRSKQLMAEGMLMEGYVADLIGSILVEKVMDQLTAQLKEECQAKGLQITNRYSPGYCEWNVAEQRQLFALLPENFCNILLSESCLMSPSKSISGFIGIGKEVTYKSYSCSLCGSVHCIYRNKKKPKNTETGSLSCQRS